MIDCWKAATASDSNLSTLKNDASSSEGKERRQMTKVPYRELM